MLDLVSEEENVGRLTGIAFERLLGLLDEENPAALQDLYATASDRYMILAGKGRRTPDENLGLDRLDSALRLMLGEHGLMVFAAQLLRIHAGARCGANAFRKAGGRIADAWLALGAAAAICRERLGRTPLPINGQRLSSLAANAAEAAEALQEMRTGHRVFGWGRRDRQAAERGTARLLHRLGRLQAGLPAWLAAGALLGPADASWAQRAARIESCYRTAGLLACTSIMQETGTAFREVSHLTREGLES